MKQTQEIESSVTFYTDWFKKELKEFNDEINPDSHDMNRALDEALDCIGCIHLGADLSTVRSYRLYALFSFGHAALFLSKDAYSKWLRKQNDRGRNLINFDSMLKALNDLADHLTKDKVKVNEEGWLISQQCELKTDCKG